MAADPFASAGDSADAQKKALLQAIADQGSVGRKAFEDAQAGVGADKQAAITAALQRANLINAPQQFTQAAQAQVASPYEHGQANLTAGQAQFESDLARQGATAGTYYDQVKQAIPISQAQAQASEQNVVANAQNAAKQHQDDLNMQLQSQLFTSDQAAKKAARDDALAKQQLDNLITQHGWDVADRTSKNSETAKENAFKRQIEELQLGQAQANAAGAQARASSAGGGGNYAGKGNPVADLLHNLGGTGAAQIQLKTPVQQAVAALIADSKAHSVKAGQKTASALTQLIPTTSSKKADTNSDFITKFRTQKQNDPTDYNQTALSREGALQLVDQSMGLPPGTLDSLLGKNSPAYTKPPGAKEVSQQQKDQFRTDPNYMQVLGSAADKLTSAKTAKEGYIAMEKYIRGAPDYKDRTDFYEQVIRDLHGSN